MQAVVVLRLLVFVKINSTVYSAEKQSDSWQFCPKEKGNQQKRNAWGFDPRIVSIFNVVKLCYILSAMIDNYHNAGSLIQSLFPPNEMMTGDTVGCYGHFDHCFLKQRSLVAQGNSLRRNFLRT